MECFAGLAAAGTGGVGATFSYNRDNFLYDRELRQRTDFQVQKFRVTQAYQWRQDIRDLISLSEYKMTVYLLVLVLVLGINLQTLCIGKRYADTPAWLMFGSSISGTGSIGFIFLSIWMAMHAAVAAQGFEARLLTQLVRLPIPSWQEIEACRTYASEFEEIAPRQMFRVPFLMGRQEQQIPEDRPLRSEELHHGAAVRTADPWGLERRGDGIAELGQHSASQIATLRHIRLAQEAMANWTSFDAYARICLSIGVVQLLISMSYFILGWVLLTVKCRSAAFMATAILSILSDSLGRLDMSLTITSSLFTSSSLLLGPGFACVAGYFWLGEEHRTAKALAATAFAFHAAYVFIVTIICTASETHHGILLPKAFKDVLYLDVFAWIKPASPPAPCGASLTLQPEQRPQQTVEADERFFDSRFWGVSDNTFQDETLPQDVHDAPRKLPGFIFTTAMWMLCLAWCCAAAWTAWDGMEHTAAGRTIIWKKDLPSKFELSLVHVAWPHGNVRPKSLACDSTGRLVVSDGLRVFAAHLPHGDAAESAVKPQEFAVFEEVACESLAGEGLQDATVTCDGSGDCLVVALHRSGRRLASCALDGKKRGLGEAWSISQQWQEKPRKKEDEAEEAVALDLDPTCHDPWTHCVLLATSQGRIVRLRPSGLELVPSVLLRDGQRSREPLEHGVLRALPNHLAIGGNGSIALFHATTGRSHRTLSLPESFRGTPHFCAAASYFYLLDSHPSPRLWRFRLPADL